MPSMHPIERLRYVARASGADQGLLVRETAGALASLGFDPPGLVTACRRIIDRHPASGPLWWLSARVLTSNDPVGEAWRAADEIADDPTPDALAHAIPDEATICLLGWPEQIGDALPRRGDLDVLVVDALGEGSGLVRRLQRADVDAIDVPDVGPRHGGRRQRPRAARGVCLRPGRMGGRCRVTRRRRGRPPRGHPSVGRRGHRASLARTHVGRARRRASTTTCRGKPTTTSCPPTSATCSSAPQGRCPLADALRRIDCPIAPELFKPST